MGGHVKSRIAGGDALGGERPVDGVQYFFVGPFFEHRQLTHKRLTDHSESRVVRYVDQARQGMIDPGGFRRGGKGMYALDITHPWDSDLDIYLIAPDATQIILSNPNGRQSIS